MNLVSMPRNSAPPSKAPGLKVAVPEEMAFRMGYIDAAQLQGLAEPVRQTGYGQCLLQLVKEGVLT